jgi:nicotinamide mononucleotide transporter
MLESAFTLWGGTVTWLEVIAFVLALACVALSVFEIHWGWPLMIVSSLLYGRLFYEHRLYGDAGLQLFFALIAVWGWWQWVFGRRVTDGAGARAAGLRIVVLSARRRVLVVLGWLIGWGLLGVLLGRATDTDVPFFDAFPTVGSVMGQVLLGRKFIESWWVWVVVNSVSIALFAYKELWLTAALYLVFLGLSVMGLARWRRMQRVAEPLVPVR